MNPPVTVLITAYNTPPKFLGEAVNSALSQDYENLEVLIVDDGSNPRLDMHLDYHPKLRYIYMEHKGLPHSYIRGMREAKGKYVAILDHDDTLTEGSISKRVEAITKANAGLVYGDINYMNGNSRVYSTRKFPDYKTFDELVEAIIGSPLAPLKHSGVMFDRQAVVRVGNYPVLPAHFDHELIISVAEKNGWAHLPEVVFNYRTHRNNVTSDYQHRLADFSCRWQSIDRHFRHDWKKRVILKAKMIFWDTAKLIYHAMSVKKPQFVLDMLSK